MLTYLSDVKYFKSRFVIYIERIERLESNSWIIQRPFWLLHLLHVGPCVCVCVGEHAMTSRRRCLLLFIHQCINSPFLLPVQCSDRRGCVLAGNFHSSEQRCAFYCYVVCVCVWEGCHEYIGVGKKMKCAKKTTTLNAANATHPPPKNLI